MSPEEFLSEFGHLAETDGGVAQVRSTIYQLAIKGGLVVQDPKEEPARLLLRNLRGEETSPQAWDGWSLPPGWEACSLDNLCSRVHYGVTAKAVDTTKGPRMLRITDIQNDRVNWDTVPGCDIDASASENATLADGDLLIARTGGTIGKTYLVENLDRKAVFASYLIRAVPLSVELSPYLKLFAGSAFYWEQLRAGTAGTGLPNVSGTKLKALRIPLPPLPEQKRIVEKVDALMALCDELEGKQKQKREKAVSVNKAALNAVLAAPDRESFKSSWSRVQDHFEVLYELPENVKELRQTILQLAVMGKLVQQSPGSHGLLGSAASDRALSSDSSSGPHRLPRIWRWAPFHEVAEVASNLVQPSAFQDAVHIAPDNIEKGTGRLLPCLTVGEDGVRSANHRFFTGQLIYSKIRPNLAKVVIAPCDGLCSADMYPINAKVNASYLKLFMLSQTFLRQAVKTDTRVAMPKINQAELNAVCVAVPPDDEQVRIVAKVEQLMSLCDELEAKLARHRDQGQRLMQAVVEGLVL